MKMQKNTNETKTTQNTGITLIALVITIIVLLILAGVTIASLTGENGLLKRAQKAKDATEVAQRKEQLQIEALGSIDNNGNIDFNTLIDNIKNNLGVNDGDINQDTDTISVTIGGNTYEIDSDGNVEEVVITDRTGIKVGDYIDYTPDVVSTTTYPVSTLTTYSGSTSNTADIIQDTLNWQVLRIYRDGSMDLIGSVTSQSIYFQGVLGYTNGVYLMDDICKTLYSRNANGIIARSVDLEDFEYWLEQSTSVVAARDAYSNGTYTYGDSATYTDNNKYPPFYETQTSESDPGTLTTNSAYTTNGDLTVKQTYYIISINNINFSDGYKALNSSTSYWIGSRYVNCYSSYALFGLRYAGTYIYGYDLFLSNGSTNYFLHLRPVVHLKSSVQITPKTGTTGDKHQITSY